MHSIFCCKLTSVLALVASIIFSEKIHFHLAVPCAVVFLVVMICRVFCSYGCIFGEKQMLKNDKIFLQGLVTSILCAGLFSTGLFLQSVLCCAGCGIGSLSFALFLFG